MGEEEKGFESFADPSFLFLLIEAQRAAASSDRESDYDVLSELLANRVKVGTYRRLYIGINKAVNMLPFVSDEQLAGIIVQFCIAKLTSKASSIAEALQAMDDCYGKIIGNVDLPTGEAWLESLEAGELVKNVSMPLHTFKKSRDIILDSFGRYTKSGIKKDSERYQQALTILHEAGLPASALVEHELNEDYVRLVAQDEDEINDLTINQVLENGIHITVPLNDVRKEAVRKVLAMYERELGLLEDFKNRFVTKFNEHPNLKKKTEWWESIPSYFELTIVGKILANANANKYDARIPIVVK